MIDHEVTRWVRTQSVPVPLDPAAPPELIGPHLGAATVLGFGAAARHAADSLTAGLTVLRDLVVHDVLPGVADSLVLGFRPRDGGWVSVP